MSTMDSIPMSSGRNARAAEVDPSVGDVPVPEAVALVAGAGVGRNSALQKSLLLQHWVLHSSIPKFPAAAAAAIVAFWHKSIS